MRSSHRDFFLDHLDPGPVNLVDELVPADAFDHGFEYAAVAVIRSMAMLVTPTCDLDGIADVGGTWIVWPIRPFKDSGLDRGNLLAGKYQNLYALPEHRHFDESFVDVTDMRPVRPQHFPARSRIASTTRIAQGEMLEKSSAAFGRVWGYAHGEKIEPPSKRETGRFRCARCNLYDIVLPEPITLKPGDEAPECENCKKIGKAAQWYPLTQHRKS